MSYLYDQYLTNHKSNVKKGFDWIRDNLPELTKGDFDFEWQIGLNHDHSKTEKDEYDAYDKYFYGGNKSYSVTQEFNKAWLLHIHRNPHHWQYWVLINDDPNEGKILIEMPYNYILEMVCDWWAFSWAKGNLREIFSWYEERKNHIKFHPNTRDTVESILNQLKVKLKGDAVELFGTESRKVFAHEYIDDRTCTRFKLPFVKRETGINDDVINKVECTFGFPLYDWQKRYLKGEDNAIPNGGRQNGKTFAYCIRLLLGNHEPFDLHESREVDKLVDENHGPHYTSYFRSYLRDLNDQLLSAGFNTNTEKKNYSEEVLKRASFIFERRNK